VQVSIHSYEVATLTGMLGKIGVRNNG